MTTSITLRSTKGSALTHSEMDANLTNLQTTADAAKAATDTLTSNKAEATALGVANTDQNMGSFTGTTIADNVSAKAGMQSLETAVETKATAAALGVTATASNMGTYTGGTIPDNETAKQNIQSLETATEIRAIRAATRSALAAFTTAQAAVYGSAVLMEAGREGVFVWSSANNSAFVTIDTAQGIYVAPSSDTTGASGAWVRKFTGHASVKWFGATGDGVTDDSAAVLAAANTHPWLFFQSGTYKIDASNSTGVRITSGSGFHFIGEGEDTIIKRFSYNPSKACIIFDSGSAAAWVTDISFSNMKFLGDVATLGHNETYGHFLSFDGVKRVLIEKCYFEGPRSDAVLVGIGAGGGTERHNYDVVIRDCVFDGVVNGVDGGRNAISFIDIDGATVADCSFRNWSRNDMPGSIDLEPDIAACVIKNVTISGNKFSNCSGNRGHVTVAVDNISNANWGNIIVIGNTFASNNAVTLYCNTTLGTAANNLIVANNIMTDVNYALNHVFGSVNGLSFNDNRVYSSIAAGGRIIIGDNTTSGWTSQDIDISNNTIVSNTAVPVVISNNITTLNYQGNIMRGGTQTHVKLGLTGNTLQRMSFTNNQFIGSLTSDIVVIAGTQVPDSNVWMNNYHPLDETHQFRALRNDFFGSNLNYKTITDAPNTYPYGFSQCRYEGVAIVSGSDTGMVETRRLSSRSDAATIQFFYPDYDSTYLDNIYFRKATNSTTWDSSGPSGGWYPIARGDVLIGTATYDWPSLATATQQSTTVTVTGAAVGDTVVVSHSTALLGTRIWGEVTAANTVTVYQRNDTGSAQDVTSGTLKARVTKG